MVELKDEADVPVAERDDVARRAATSDSAPSIGDRALIDAIEPAEHVQQRALPDARRADDRDHLAGLDRQIEIAQHGQRVAADRVALDDAARFEKGIDYRLVTTARRLEAHGIDSDFVPSCLRGSGCASFVPQRLRGIEPRGLTRRIDRRDEADEDGGRRRPARSRAAARVNGRYDI